MTLKRGKLLFLSLLAGILMLPAMGHAEEGEAKKPPIIVKQGGTTYVFKSQNEKFRSMLLNSKNLRIRHRKDDDRDYYRHHRYIRDHENYENDPSRVGFAGGYYYKSRDND